MSTISKRMRKLDEIYDSLPTVKCKGLCHQFCAAVPVYDVELVRLERAAKRKLPVLDVGTPDRNTNILTTNELQDPSCPLLLMRRCTVYSDRPLICRLFGVAEGLPCPHGCEPTKKISDHDVIKIQRRMEKL